MSNASSSSSLIHITRPYNFTSRNFTTPTIPQTSTHNQTLHHPNAVSGARGLVQQSRTRSSPSRPSILPTSMNSFPPCVAGPSTQVCVEDSTEAELSMTTELPKAVPTTEELPINAIPMGPPTKRRCDLEAMISRWRYHLEATKKKYAGEALPREKWQPDADYRFCSFPFCTYTFSPGFNPLGSGRHHCRLCGKLFCGSHSSHRAKLIFVESNGRRSARNSRVCDSCLPKGSANKPDEPRRASLDSVEPGNSQVSGNGESSGQSAAIVTPGTERRSFTGSNSSALYFGRHKALSPPSTLEVALAPIEPWMDKSGILSRYPLAVNPSQHRGCGVRQRQPPPSAGPLFTPSPEARRNPAEWSRKQLTVYQRRQMGMAGLLLDFSKDDPYEADEDEEEFRVVKKGPSAKELHDERLLELSRW